MSTETDPERGTQPRENLADKVSAVARSVNVRMDVPAARLSQALADAPPITRRPRPAPRKKWRRRLPALVLITAAAGAAGWYWQPLEAMVRAYVSPKSGGALANIQTYTVRRGDLRITMIEEGKLRAVNNSTIRMGVSGKIAWLAEAGAKVKKGDKVASIDVKEYEDQLRIWQADLETAQKQREIAEKQLPIAQSNGKAAVAAAETALGDKELALKQYTTIDVPKKLNDLETAVNDARTKLSDATKKRVDLQTQLDEMLNEGAEKDKLSSDVTLAKQTEAALKRTVQTNEDQRKLFRSYNYPQDLKTKQRAVENAKLEVTKAQVSSDNEFLAKQAEVQRLVNSIARTTSNIKQYQDMVDKATATAPTDGLVFYGGQDLEERYGQSSDSIKVGAQWYSSYPIMTIPDLSSFQVTVPIAEVYRGRVNIGMLATVTVDAVPGLVLDGKLKSVSSVSRPKVQYDSSSPPVYDAVLSLSAADPRMVAGMTARVEVVTGVLSNVIYAPVEAVFNEEGKTAVFMWVDGENPRGGHVEKRPVLTGQSNDHFVELKKGAVEGDKFLLSRPTAFVTPGNYREQVDAMFPASTAPAASQQAAAGSAPGGTEGAGTPAVPPAAIGRAAAAVSSPAAAAQSMPVSALPAPEAATVVTAVSPAATGPAASQNATK